MNLTDNREYPYPQCSPPLIKDASNAPSQTRQLAEAIDADLDTVSSLITSTYQLPTTILRITAAASVASGSMFPFDTTEYDNQGWATSSTITVDTAGVFLLTGFAHSVLLTNVQSLALQFTVNGAGFNLQGTSPPVTNFGRMTASSISVQTAAGAVFGMRPFYSGTDPSDFDNCWFSVTRMVAF